MMIYLVLMSVIQYNGINVYNIITTDIKEI